MENTQLEVILDALNKAATAHGIHEAEFLGGVYDEQWPEWYAEHMLATFTAAGYGVTSRDTSHTRNAGTGAIETG